MNFGPTQSYQSTVKGLRDFLYQCPSVAMATAINEIIGNMISKEDLDPQARLDQAILGKIHEALYDRGSDLQSQQMDLLAMFATALGGHSAAQSSNPMEDRLRFIENLREQLSETGRLDFQRAFTQAVSR